MGRSCGNRHCPSCQQDKTKAWLEAQTDRLLPCPYFLLTFTVPAACAAGSRSSADRVRRAVRGVQRGDQDLGGRSQVRRRHDGRLLRGPAYLGPHPGVSSARPLRRAGRGLSDDGTRWLPSHAHFLVPVHALSILFRAKFRDALDRAGVLTQVDPAVWRQDWVVHSQAVGDGRASLKYLAPYVFRVAISDRRIVSCDDGKVTFSYRKSGSNRWRKMTVDGSEFVRRFLQHVLPTGFQKVRHYGFLSPNSRVSLELVRWLIALYQGLVFVLRVRLPQEAAGPASDPLRRLRRADDRRRFRALRRTRPLRYELDDVQSRRHPRPVANDFAQPKYVEGARRLAQRGPSGSLRPNHAAPSRPIEPWPVSPTRLAAPPHRPTPPRLTLQDVRPPNRFPIQRMRRTSPGFLNQGLEFGFANSNP